MGKRGGVPPVGPEAAVQARYNAVAKPFSWKFTRCDLDALLDRIDAHEAQRSPQLAA